MQTEQVVFFKEMRGNKGQDTRYWEKYSRRSCANFYYGEAVQAPLFPSPGSMPGPQQYKLQ
jgi:hypothetical protein